MKQSKAIEILQRQKAKIPNIIKANAEIWKTQTASYIKSFFGEDSPEYKGINEFRFWENINVMQGTESSGIKNKIPIAEEFIQNCIETINDKGLKKREWKHILVTTHPALFWSIFWAVYLASVALAFWAGQLATNKSNEVPQEQTQYKYDSTHT